MLTNSWLKARELTSNLGINTPPLPPKSFVERKYINDSLVSGVLSAVDREYRGKSIDNFLLKCFSVHNYIYNILYDELKTPCYLTLGWVNFDGTPYFKHSEQEISEWIKSGLPDVDKSVLHCWITFPSGEMLDATIGSVIATSQGKKDLLGQLMWLETEDSGPFIYHPTAIGFEALKAMGALI